MITNSEVTTSVKIQLAKAYEKIEKLYLHLIEMEERMSRMMEKK